MAKGGNPQGKGLTPVLSEWRAAQPALIRRRDPGQVIGDYFTTLLVLSAEFNFKPAPGVNYYLYLQNADWKLSLIAPKEWLGREPGPCLGRCELQPDMTWRLDARKDAGEHPALAQAVDAFYEGFLTLLDRDESLEENLPHYVSHLPYYRRLLAAGLASSLKASLELSGLTQRRGREWLASASPLSLGHAD